MAVNPLLSDTLSPYQNFRYALKSKDVQRQYPSLLNRFLTFLQFGGNMGEKCIQLHSLAKENSSLLQSYLIKYCVFQKERIQNKEISEGTLRNYLKPIKLFFEMNDIVVPWKKIIKGLPSPKQAADDRSPNVDEIRKLLDFPDRRIRVIVLIMLSSGIRVGAWNWLKWKHVTPVYHKNSEELMAAKLQVYVKENEEYFTFMTPEAYSVLKDYMNFRTLHGEKITGDSWLVRDTWQKIDKRHGHRIGLAKFPKKLDSEGIRRMIYDAWKVQGIIENLERDTKNHEFKSSHGFRKFFETHTMQVMNSSNVELLMGHSSSMGLKKSYYKPSLEMLLDDYIKAVNLLTINEENRLKKRVEELTFKQDEVLLLRLKHEEEINAMKNQMSTLQESQKEILELLRYPDKLMQVASDK
jgi:site-specific recombinase XerC